MVQTKEFIRTWRNHIRAFNELFEKARESGGVAPEDRVVQVGNDVWVSSLLECVFIILPWLGESPFFSPHFSLACSSLAPPLLSSLALCSLPFTLQLARLEMSDVDGRLTALTAFRDQHNRFAQVIRRVFSDQAGRILTLFPATSASAATAAPAAPAAAGGTTDTAATPPAQGTPPPAPSPSVDGAASTDAAGNAAGMLGRFDAVAEVEAAYAEMAKLDLRDMSSGRGTAREVRGVAERTL